MPGPYSRASLGQPRLQAASMEPETMYYREATPVEKSLLTQPSLR